MPMLTVDHVSRRYGSRLALRDVSFTAQPHEIIALMGRNGAGKSTLMNVLTGYLAMTEGRAIIGGHDVQKEPLEARKLVGYLPEQPSLYPDLTVTEYLRYCAQLKGLPHRGVKAEIDRVIQRTALQEYAKRLTSRLSKGYRQRLGMAQALLGKPALLILDEPSSGLDPLQMVQMRELVVSAAEDSTVLLSSHMLSEVTNVCTRALILDQGSLRFDGAMQTLLTSANTLRLTYSGGENILEALRALPGVTDVQTISACETETTLEIQGAESADLRAAVSQCAAVCGALVLELTPERGGLESAFLRLLDKEVNP